MPKSCPSLMPVLGDKTCQQKREWPLKILTESSPLTLD